MKATVSFLLAACMSDAAARTPDRGLPHFPHTRRSLDNATLTAQQVLTEYQKIYGKPVQEAPGEYGQQGLSNSFIPDFVKDLVHKQSSQNPRSPESPRNPQQPLGIAPYQNQLEQQQMPHIPEYAWECINELELNMWRARELQNIRQSVLPTMQPSAVLAVKGAYDTRLLQLKITATGESSQQEGPPLPLSAAHCKNKEELWNWRASVLTFIREITPLNAQQRQVARVRAAYVQREQELANVADQIHGSQKISKTKTPEELAGQTKASNGQHVLALGFLFAFAFFVPAGGAWLRGLLVRGSHTKLEEEQLLPLDNV